jgi:hypothetical protein
MWPKNYKDYKEDAPLVQQKLEPGKGIVGCEMHDLNGWGDSLHVKKRKQGAFSRFIQRLFEGKK